MGGIKIRNNSYYRILSRISFSENSFIISYKPSLLAIGFISFGLSMNAFISPSILENNIARYRILFGSRPFFLVIPLLSGLCYIKLEICC